MGIYRDQIEEMMQKCSKFLENYIRPFLKLQSDMLIVFQWVSGKKVTILEMLPALMSGRAQAPLPVSLMMIDMLPAAGIKAYTGASFKKYEDGKALCRECFF